MQSSLGLDNKGRGTHNSNQQGRTDEEVGAKGNALPKLQEGVSETKLQLQQLYVALGAMDDALKRSGTTRNSSTDINEWWSRINQLSNRVQDSLNRIDQEHFQTLDEDIGGDDNDENDTVQVSSKHSQGEHSYTMEANTEKEQEKLTAPKLTKTSVFSGKGALKQPKLKPSHISEQGQRSSPGVHRSSTELPQGDPLAQHFLLSELRTRLQTLSLPEEEHEVVDLEEDYEMVKSAPAPVARTHVEKTTAMPSFGGLLVGELSNAVKLLSSQNESNDEETISYA